MKIRSFGGSATLVIAIVCSPAEAAGAPCESLAALTLPDTTITSAQTVAAGAFTPPEGRFPAAAGARFRASVADLSAFCRVAATLRPSSDSDIKIEVWLPVEGWNGKYQAAGNGGWAGSISYRGMASALRRGYATSSTDTGHTGNGGDASFAHGHPEKLYDFAHRSIHEMSVKSKLIIGAFYGAAPSRSYFRGCSTGGRQGLVEAQLFPTDFDGVISVAPAIDQVRLNAWYVWVAQAALTDPESYIPLAKYSLIHKAVLDTCDARDGVTDGVIGDPDRCEFDPLLLLCEAGDEESTCLSALQVEAAQGIYAGPKNPRTQELIAPGLEPGSELGWATLAGGPGPNGIADTYFKYIVFNDPDWDFKTLDFDQDFALAKRIDEGRLDATNPDIGEFASRGGKLLMIHGRADQYIAPQFSIDYYQSVLDRVGSEREVGDFLRLFLAPGMAHCGGGSGPSRFDDLSILERWVETGQAPDKIVASHPPGDDITRSRPLCPYPQLAIYKGTGSTDEAGSFECRPQR